jgi:hypothetical protein
MKEKFRPKITLFCCVNVLNNGDFTNFASAEDLQIKTIKMAQKYSPVFNSITKPIPVSVQLDKG